MIWCDHNVSGPHQYLWENHIPGPGHHHPVSRDNGRSKKYLLFVSTTQQNYRISSISCLLHPLMEPKPTIPAPIQQALLRGFNNRMISLFLGNLDHHKTYSESVSGSRNCHRLSNMLPQSIQFLSAGSGNSVQSNVNWLWMMRGGDTLSGHLLTC